MRPSIDAILLKPQVSSSNLEVGSNTHLAESLLKPAVFGAHLEQEVPSWSVVIGDADLHGLYDFLVR